MTNKKNEVDTELDAIREDFNKQIHNPAIGEELIDYGNNTSSIVFINVLLIMLKEDEKAAYTFLNANHPFIINNGLKTLNILSQQFDELDETEEIKSIKENMKNVFSFIEKFITDTYGEES